MLTANLFVLATLSNIYAISHVTVIDGSGRSSETKWSFAWIAVIVPRDRAVDAGRIVAHRARIARKQGDTDFAQQLYAHVERLGETSAEPELTAPDPAGELPETNAA